ncbi:MAG: bifunctional UDP-sugar hydrolase/5'-nucleotidase [Pseudoclavibacter sp.]|nr:bifunctional UDP-sugar hydrolase/5'-nucleotidase [Pseudoclavibacter sp.]
MLRTRARTRKAAAGLAAAALAAAGLVLGAPAHAEVRTPEIIQPTPGARQINLLGFNDFHGRILDAEAFTATMLAAEEPFGPDRTLLVSSGDLVGATIFESSIAGDQPSIDFARLAGVDVYTLGNHEFDRGAADAIERIAPATAGPDLAANVTRADGSHPFDTHTILTVDGVRVAIIGAVTAETPSLVSPDGVADLRFGDPVEAVNRVAEQLSASGAADVVVASYHEGGPASEQEANLSVEAFRAMTERTSPEVDVILNGHTHVPYAYELPSGAGGGSRPVVQAAAYAGSIAQVVLTLGPDGEVSADSSIVPRLAAEAIPERIASSPVLGEVRELVSDAVAQAEVLGRTPVGTLAGDITRGKQYEPGSLLVDPQTGRTSGGVVTQRDDRAASSALGDVVAQSMLDAANAIGHEADLAVMNPGGLRADLLDDDGLVSYREAQQVLPFTNNLSLVTVTGATLREILEQQWQLDERGQVPSRPYLQLGLSDSISYAFDPDRPAGERITGIAVDGTPVDPAAEYRVVVPSFLAAGGDNFRAFRDAVRVADTGLIDLDAFTRWIGERSADGRGGFLPDAVGADERRNSMRVRGYPFTEPLACGTTVQLEAGELDHASLGFLRNTAVAAQLHWTDVDGSARSETVGTGEVDADGVARLSIRLPESVSSDGAQLTLVADRSGTTVLLPVQSACRAPGPSPSGPAEGTRPDPSRQPGPDHAGGRGDGGSDDAGQGAESRPADRADLARTGAEANALFGGIAGGIAVLVLGATALVLRRRVG